MNAPRSDRVVVGVDGSQESMQAVRWAGVEAARLCVPLRLVRVFGWTDEVVAGHQGLGDHYREILLRQARAGLEAAAELATQRHPGLTVEPDLVLGHPIGVLVDESRHARLLVVGDRGLSRIGSLVAGSVAVAMAAHASCPVVVVRGAESPALATMPVVVGVDGTPASEAAIPFAFAAASARGVPLIAVHAWSGVIADVEYAAIVDWDAMAEEHEELLAERLAGWSEKYPDVHVDRVVSRSGAVRRLLDLSASAQLVVVGSRGHAEFAGIVLGSVSNVLVHRAACPVAVIRPATSDGG
ncbi:universal stress protein [Pseudonocardia sp. GCM10023141]|uniref:universal stress protein n=1 Tax=Pseudonocardia sp. GCM10023141 TaxID=3252653 RepID=UPI0036089785